MSKNEETAKSRRNHPRSGAGSNTKPSKIDTYTFVEGHLDEKDRQWLEDNIDSQHERILELVCDLQPGLKLSISFDQRSNRFLATLSCSDLESADCGKILTSRGATPDSAAFALWYRHNVKFQAGWGESQHNTSLWD